MKNAPPEDGESHKERVDRELGEMLEEVRVAIPGAEVLFAFLLGVAFTNRFSEVTTLQRNVYFATLLLTAGATALLIAPTAYHRLDFRGGDKERLVFSGTRMAVTALGMLLCAISGVVFLVGDLLYGTAAAGVAAALVSGWFLLFWFALPLARRSGRT